MRWLKRDMWKVGFTLASLLFFMVIMVWLPASSFSAFARTSESGTSVTGTATPTVDPTMTALQKEQLTQQVRQLDNWWLYWLYNGSTAIIAGLASIGVAYIGFTQWRGNRKAEREKEKEVQNKELRDRAEERFKAAIAALGDENEGTQVGGAILLRSFLHKADEKIYGRYYTQIFDLAAAYLHLPSTSQPSEDTDGTPPSPRGPATSLPLTPLRQALIVVFKEAFPLARNKLKEQDPKTHFDPQSLDATGVKLDAAYLAGADLKQAWMPKALLQNADLTRADLRRANLSQAILRLTVLFGADLSGANLGHADLCHASLDGANLKKATLMFAIFSEAHLRKHRFLDKITDLSSTMLSGANFHKADLGDADLSGSNLSGVDFSEADLSRANLSKAYLSEFKMTVYTFEPANLTGANLSDANLSGANLTQASLVGADLRGANLTGTILQEVKYNTKEIQVVNEKGEPVINQHGKPVTIEPTQWPQGFKPDGAVDTADEASSPSQPSVSPPLPSQGSDKQVPSATPPQASTPLTSTDGSSSTSAQPSAEP